MKIKRFMCILMASVMLAGSLSSSCSSVFAAESESSDEPAATAESSGAESSGAESSVVESSELESSEAGFSEAESSEAGFSEAESSAEVSFEFEPVSEMFFLSDEGIYGEGTDTDSSYDEGIAPQAEVAAGIALSDILLDLIMSAGVTYLGYTSVKELKKNSAAYNSLKESFLSNAVVGKAIDNSLSLGSIPADPDTEEGTKSKYDDPGNLFHYRYVVNLGGGSSGGGEGPSGGGEEPSGGGGKGFVLTLGASLIAAAVAAVKEWANSDANKFDDSAASDQAGTVQVDSEYIKSMTTTVKLCRNINSMSDLDSFFGIDGISDFLSLQGYSDSTHYFFIIPSGGFSVLPIPLGYTLSHVSLSGSYITHPGLYAWSNSNYKNVLNQSGVRPLSDFATYFKSLPTAALRYYSYNVSSCSFVEKSYQENLSIFYYYLLGRFSPFYTCNYQSAFNEGDVPLNVTEFSGSSINRTLYSFKTSAKHINFDWTKSPSIPSDGVEFNIPESDYSGFNWTDLSGLMNHVSGLSKTLGDISDNQGEIIEQNKGILEILNKIHPIIKAVSDDTGKIAVQLLSIDGAIKELPQKMADALAASFPSPAPALDTAALSKALSDAVSAALEPLPPAIAEAVGNIEIAVPEVVIPPITLPEIVVPEIVIPEIKPPVFTIPDDKLALLAPNITLNPNYDITVKNDFTGLEGIISRAVEGVLVKLFVPNQDAALQKVGDMKGYFAFKDEVEDSVGELKSFLFGITPSPVLKIPVGSVSSKKYNYGLGDYITIDISWYSRYKPFGDKFILAVVWALFLWRLFLKLPGIISGVEGSIMSANSSYHKSFSGKE